MQRIIILLSLFILSAPVLAGPSDDHGKHLGKYRTYPNGFDSYQSQSENSVRKDPHYLKLLINIKKDQQIVTVKT
jgi:hypothetical protein